MFSCPSCGGKIIFDIDRQKPVCEYCSTAFNVEDLGPGITQNVTTYETSVYVCKNCGTEVTSPDNQVVSFCSFCGSESILEERTASIHSPETILPFRVSKKEMHQKYADALKGVRYLPKDFKDPKRIDSMRGIYMPYWAIAADFQPRLDFKVTSVTSLPSNYERVNDYTGSFSCRTKTRFLTDASSALDDTVAAQIEPFSEEDAVPFHPAYLAGFYADKADVPPEKYMAQVNEKARKDAVRAIKAACPDKEADIRILPTVRDEKSPLIIMPEDREDYEASLVPASLRDYHEALMPVWFLTHRSKKRVSYTIANGANGKFYTDLPVDQPKFWLVTAGIAAVLFALLSLIFFLRPQTALVLSIFVVALTMQAFRSELVEFVIHETHLLDLGATQTSPDALQKTRKKIRERKSNKTAAVVMTWVFIGFFGFLFLIPDAWGFSAFAFCTYSVIVGAFQLHAIIKDTRKLHSTLLMIVGIAAYVTIIAGIVLLIVKPVSDLWFYGGCLFCLLGALALSAMMIHCYNLKASRPLPQYFRREGGLNDAQ